MPSDTQSIIVDSQSYNINIDQIYKDIISYIESMRGHVNILDPNNQTFFKKITKDNFSGGAIDKGIKIEIDPQESRCHAFYRILGFPVAADDKIYNSGLDFMLVPDRKVTVDNKVEIANSVNPEFKKLSDRRERYVQETAAIFNNPSSMDACIYALSTSNVRETFGASFKNSDMKDFDPENQSYNISDKGLVGYKTILFKEYQNNSKKTAEKYSSKRYHIIKPFLVDARIDLTTPGDKKIAVPFVLNDSYLSINDYTSAKKPLIEKIILDRFVVLEDLQNIGSSAQRIVNSIKQFTSIKDESLVKEISSGQLYGIDEKKQFEKYLNIIKSMMVKLVEAQNKILEAQRSYYYLPYPPKNGPEGTCSVQDVFPQLYENFSTSKDRALIKLQYKQSLSSLTAETSSLRGVPDSGYAFSKFTETFEPTTTSAYGNTLLRSIEKASAERKELLEEANKALRTIEIITGEFSGLGLCDIIVIMASLYIMNKNDLLGFLDADSYDRAKLKIKKGLPESNPSNIDAAQTELGKKVFDFYNLVDKIYQDVKVNNIK